MQVNFYVKKICKFSENVLNSCQVAVVNEGDLAKDMGYVERVM
jgi:hypothetical protein